MAKLLDGMGVTALWKLVKREFRSSIIRIFWDSSSESFMYDTMDNTNLDFPIQAVRESGMKPGLITPRDKRTLKTVQDNGFMTTCSFATNSPQYKNTLQLSVTTVPKNAGASENELIVKEVSNIPVPVATTAHDGAMSSEDKQMLNEVADFHKATTTPYASHPFAFDYCKLMDADIVMTVGNKNLWCVTVLLNDTEDQTYMATYDGQVLARKQYNYQHTNMPQGDITTWFISLPTSAEKESCVIGVS